MSVWPNYEDRWFEVSEELARTWDQKVRESGLELDCRARRAQTVMHFTGYCCAAVVQESGKVLVGVFDRRPAILSAAASGMDASRYLLIHFRVNPANTGLADAIGRIILGSDAKLAGRFVRRLGGRWRPVGQ